VPRRDQDENASRSARRATERRIRIADKHVSRLALIAGKSPEIARHPAWAAGNKRPAHMRKSTSPGGRMRSADALPVSPPRQPPSSRFQSTATIKLTRTDAMLVFDRRPLTQYGQIYAMTPVWCTSGGRSEPLADAGLISTAVMATCAALTVWLARKIAKDSRLRQDCEAMENE